MAQPKDSPQAKLQRDEELEDLLGELLQTSRQQRRRQAPDTSAKSESAAKKSPSRIRGTEKTALDIESSAPVVVSSEPFPEKEKSAVKPETIKIRGPIDDELSPSSKEKKSAGEVISLSRPGPKEASEKPQTDGLGETLQLQPTPPKENLPSPRAQNEKGQDRPRRATKLQAPERSRKEEGSQALPNAEKSSKARGEEKPNADRFRPSRSIASEPEQDRSRPLPMEDGKSGEQRESQGSGRSLLWLPCILLFGLAAILGGRILWQKYGASPAETPPPAERVAADPTEFPSVALSDTMEKVDDSSPVPPPTPPDIATDLDPPVPPAVGSTLTPPELASEIPTNPAPPVKETPPTAEVSAPAVPFKPIEENEARSALKDFLTAKSLEKRKEWVLPNSDGEELDAGWLATLQAASFKAPPEPSFDNQERGFGVLVGRPGSAGLVNLGKVRAAGLSPAIAQGYVLAIFKRDGNGEAKLDWPLFRQTAQAGTVRFLTEAKPGESKILRVNLGRRSNDGATDLVLRLAPPSRPVDDGVVFTGPSSTAFAKEVEGRLPPQKATTATVELTWEVPAEPSRPPRLAITKLVCWEFLGIGGVASAPIEVKETHAMLIAPPSDR